MNECPPFFLRGGFCEKHHPTKGLKKNDDVFIHLSFGCDVYFFHGKREPLKTSSIMMKRSPAPLVIGILYPYHQWDWYISLHEWLMFMVFM